MRGVADSISRPTESADSLSIHKAIVFPVVPEQLPHRHEFPTQQARVRRARADTMSDILRCSISRELSDDVVYLGVPDNPSSPDEAIGFDRPTLYEYLDRNMWQGWIEHPTLPGVWIEEANVTIHEPPGRAPIPYGGLRR